MARGVLGEVICVDLSHPREHAHFLGHEIAHELYFHPSFKIMEEIHIDDR